MEEGQGIVGPVICAAGVLRVEMACGVDPGTYVLERSDAQENWAMYFGGMVGKGGGNKAGLRQGQQRLHREHPEGMAMAITQAPTPALACIAGVTGKEGDGKDVIVLIAVVAVRGVKTNNI